MCCRTSKKEIFNNDVEARKSTFMHTDYQQESELNKTKKIQRSNISSPKTFSIKKKNNSLEQIIKKKNKSEIHKSDYYNTVKFPTVKFFGPEKRSLTGNLNEAIKKGKEDQKKKCIPTEYFDHPDYIEFTRELKNPALGKNYLHNKYKRLYEDFGNIEKDENKFVQNYSNKKFNNVLIAMKVKNDVDDNKYKQTQNTRFAQVSKLKLKWKTIKWLTENKKENLEKLMKNQDILLKFSQGATEGLNKKEFADLMISNQVTKDQDLINKLFWVFDEDGSGDIEYKELACGLEMFRDSNTEQKLKVFFDLCDEDGSGAVSKTEFCNSLKKNIINSSERLTMKQVVDKIFKSVELNENGEITFEKLKRRVPKEQAHLRYYRNKSKSATRN